MIVTEKANVNVAVSPLRKQTIAAKRNLQQLRDAPNIIISIQKCIYSKLFDNFLTILHLGKILLVSIFTRLYLRPFSIHLQKSLHIKLAYLYQKFELYY